MLGHQANQYVLLLFAGQGELFERSIIAAQDCGGRYTQRTENVADLALIERILPVLTVAVRDVSLIQQGDRPATRASGPRADQLEHVGPPGWS